MILELWFSIIFSNMGNGVEKGNSNSQEQHPTLPGVFKMDGVWVRWVEGRLYRVIPGEDFARIMSEVENRIADSMLGQGASFKKSSPIHGNQEGEQRHTRITPQSPDKI